MGAQREGAELAGPADGGALLPDGPGHPAGPGGPRGRGRAPGRGGLPPCRAGARGGGGRERAGGGGGGAGAAFKPSAHTWDTQDYTGKERAGGAAAGAGDASARRIQRMWAERAGTEESLQTQGLCSGSFTSTAMDVQTRNQRRREVRSRT